MEKSVLDWIALVLVIIGGLNWGFAVFDFNLLSIFGGTFATILEVLIGLSALYMIYYVMKD